MEPSFYVLFHQPMYSLLSIHDVVQTTQSAAVQEAGVRQLAVSLAGHGLDQCLSHAEERLPLGYGHQRGETSN